MLKSNRAIILTMLGAVSAVSYLQRVCISILSPRIMEDLSLSPTQMGWIFSAFMLGYALFQYPSGSLADRFGGRCVLGWAMFAWGVFTAATGLIEQHFVASLFGSVNVLLGIRFLLGVAEAPTYPTSARVVSTWFDKAEQGRATSVFSMGMAVGSAVAPPLVVWLMLGCGWKCALWIISVPAFLMAMLWSWQGAEGPRKAPIAKDSTDRGIFRNKNLWLITISYFLNNYVFYIFAFWFFPYLVNIRGFDIEKSSWIATAPWILTIFLTPLGGAISDWLVKRTGENWGRRLLPLVSMPLAGLLLSFGARTHNAFLAVVGLTACVGLVMLVDAVYWAAAIRVAPRSAGGSSGLMNMGGNLGGFVSASLTPFIAERVGIWTGDEFQGWVVGLDVTAALAVLAGLLWFAITLDNRKGDADHHCQPI